MSPGCATRVTCADGTRAFVKAVGRRAEPRHPGRCSAARSLALTLLGATRCGPTCWRRTTTATGSRCCWRTSRAPTPTSTTTRPWRALLEATDELGRVMAERVPAAPAPDPDRGGLNDLARVLREVGRTPSTTSRTSPPTLLPAVGGRGRRGLQAQRARADRPPGRLARALGHPQRQPAAAAVRRAGVRRLGRSAESARTGSTPCSRGSNGWTRPGSTPRWRPPRRWSGPATRR